MGESQYFSAEEGSIESGDLESGDLESGIRTLSLQEMPSQSTGFAPLNTRSAKDSASTVEQNMVQNQSPTENASNAFSHSQYLQECSNSLNNSSTELSSRSDEVASTLIDHPIASSITRLAAMGVFSKITGFGLINPVVRDDSLLIMNQPPFVLDRVPYTRRPRIWPIPEPSSNADAIADEQAVLEESNSWENLSGQTLMNQNIIDVAYKLLALIRDANLGVENPDLISRRVEDIDIGKELMPQGREKGSQHVQHLVASQLQKLNKHPIRDEDIPLGDSASTFGDRVETLPYGTHRYSSMGNVLSSKVCKDKLSSNLRDQAIPINDDLIDQRVVNVANQLLATINPGNNPHLASNMIAEDIAQDYLKLYASTRPENYDFAMNIMAYVELLNDNSWSATFSHFDENVKKVIKYIWDEQKPDFYKRINLQQHNREMILKLLFDLTRWSIDKNLDLSQLLSHSVIMCKIGVFARKHIFKTAPLYVISQLREIIKLLKFENILQFLFDMVVKDFSRRLVQQSRV